MNIAIIGCGSYGAEHAQFLTSCVDVNLRAVSDIVSKRAEAFANTYNADYSTTDVRQIWSDPSIDAVWICTQHHTHAPLAEAAAAAGKHFFLEKPLALTLTDCNRIVSAVENSGVVAAVGFKLRFFPAVVAAKKFLGTPTLTTAHVLDDHWPSEFWANDPIQGGGNVLSPGCHIVDASILQNTPFTRRLMAFINEDVRLNFVNKCDGLSPLSRIEMLVCPDLPREMLATVDQFQVIAKAEVSDRGTLWKPGGLWR